MGNGAWPVNSQIRHFVPGLPLLLHQPAVGGCGEAMPSRAKVIADGAEGRQETLQLLGRLEALLRRSR
jgi:hypothetical protein